ncbi:MAG: ABC transporter substrate-binding protein [Pyramidobacter sp.]|jgi:ABC-type transport system substrate-binding protein
MKRFWLACMMFFIFADTVFARQLTTLNVGFSYDAKSLDPLQAVDTLSFSVIKQINETLVTVDGHTKKLVPVLAERWEILDPQSYKFYLKKGVKFHNGEELTADDVVFSFKRALSPESLYAKSKAKYIDPDGFEIIDKYTLIVRTRGPVGGWLESMKHPYASIYNRKAVESAGKEYFRNPVGTGPFKFKKWVKGDRIELTAFDEYHGEKARFKNLNFLVISDDSSRVISVETGNTDLIYSFPASDFERINEDGKAKAIQTPGLVLTYLGMNTQKGALKDVRVRKAIEYAIDKDAYVHVVYQNKGVVPPGPLVPASTFVPARANVYKRNVVEARRLLAEAGYADGLELELWAASNQKDINGATVLQAMLAEVGIKINVSVMESGVFDDRVMHNQQDLIISQWGMQTNRDAGQFWLSLFHSASIGATNWTLLKDSEVDRLLDLANSTVDTEKRDELLQKVWDRLDELHPFVSLVVPNEIYGIRKDLVGAEDFVDGRLNYLGNLYVQ